MKITQIQNCTGCHACMTACPNEAISMREDKEGFLYPFIFENKCTRCGICKNSCPVLHQKESMKSLFVYAVKNNNLEERLTSSSGGVFSLLAKKIIIDGGIVFGACFDDDFNVKHIYIQQLKEIKILQGSKYVQSIIGDSYRQVEFFLQTGKKVLFSGTPCQIAGLKQFLQKEYETLYTIDLICHGVPSPKVWRQYLKEIIKQEDITDIDFRDKRNGWQAYNITAMGKSKELFSEHYSNNIYMRGFLQNLFLRPSCHQCPAKQFKSKSDITLGDFWGIQKFYPDFNDDKGISLVFTNTQKGLELFKKLDVAFIEIDYEKAINANPTIEKSAKTHPKRQLFFQLFEQKQDNINQLVKQMLHRSFADKVKGKIKRILKVNL